MAILIAAWMWGSTQAAWLNKGVHASLFMIIRVWRSKCSLDAICCIDLKALYIKNIYTLQKSFLPFCMCSLVDSGSSAHVSWVNTAHPWMASQASQPCWPRKCEIIITPPNEFAVITQRQQTIFFMNRTQDIKHFINDSFAFLWSHYD